jgi:DNA polymerase-3 subunit delta
MSILAEIKKIEAQDIKNLYLVKGDSSYLIDLFLHALKNKILDNKISDFNYYNFNLKNSPLNKFLETIRTNMIFTSKRLIICEQIDSLSKQNLLDLIPYIKNSFSDTILVFVCANDIKEKEFTLAIKNSGEILEFNKPNQRELPFWINFIANKYNIKLSSELAFYLQEGIGNDLYHIQNEIEKIVCFLPNEKNIEYNNVAEIISCVKIHTIFEFTDSIFEKKLDHAIKYLNELLYHGNHPVYILHMIGRYLRKLIWAKFLLNEDRTRSEIIKELAIYQFLANKFFTHLNNFSSSGLIKLYRELHKLDRIYKFENYKSNQFLERFVFDACVEEKA